jgi:hypothetical protein
MECFYSAIWNANGNTMVLPLGNGNGNKKEDISVSRKERGRLKKQHSMRPLETGSEEQLAQECSIHSGRAMPAIG